MNTPCFDFKKFLKRCSLLLIPTIVLLTIIFHRQHDLIYMPIATGISSFILFVNFPKVVLMFHQRPLYYDDLVIKDYSREDTEQIYDEKFRHRYQHIFRWVVTVTSALMIGVLTEIWYIRSDFVQGQSQQQQQQSQNSFIKPDIAAALAIIISLGSGYLKISVLFGKLLMKILKYFKRKQIARRRAEHQRRTVIELTSANIQIDDMAETKLLQEQGRVRSEGNLQILGLQQSTVTEIFH